MILLAPIKEQGFNHNNQKRKGEKPMKKRREKIKEGKCAQTRWIVHRLKVVGKSVRRTGKQISPMVVFTVEKVFAINGRQLARISFQGTSAIVAICDIPHTG